MSKVYEIDKHCLRYVVAFTYKGSFDEAILAVKNQEEEIYKRNKETKEKEPTGEYRQLWTELLESTIKTESDLYEYVRNEFLFDDSANQPKEKNGCEWLFWKSKETRQGGGKSILELAYFDDKINSKSNELLEFKINIMNLGLILFRNNIGFIWYDVDLPKAFDTQQLMLFQYRFRELNRDEKETYFWEKTRNKSERSIVIGGNDENKEYIVPFSMGQWLAKMLSFLKVEFFAKRKSAFENEAMVPDKALLFTYCAFENDETQLNEEVMTERESLAYQLTNGYKDSYHPGEEIISEMKHPFREAIWYATKEGAAYLAWPEKDNKAVFTDTIPKKVSGDYFCLYIKALYQSYSMLLYAQRIQNEMPAENNSEALNESITKLFSEINLFLTKSMATSVSHIHHQSEFYIYLKKQLRIHEDIKSVTAGLNALDTLRREQWQREDRQRIADEWKTERDRDRQAQAEADRREEAEKQRDNQTQTIIGLFAILGVFSALVDCFDFIQRFGDGEGWSDATDVIKGWEIAGWVFIGAIVLLTLPYFVNAIKIASCALVDLIKGITNEVKTKINGGHEAKKYKNEANNNEKNSHHADSNKEENDKGLQ